MSLKIVKSKGKAGIKMREISITDFDNLKIGNSENVKAGTGCTVFIFENGAAAGLDVRGGGPASSEAGVRKF